MEKTKVYDIIIVDKNFNSNSLGLCVVADILLCNLEYATCKIPHERLESFFVDSEYFEGWSNLDYENEVGGGFSITINDPWALFIQEGHMESLVEEYLNLEIIKE